MLSLIAEIFLYAKKKKKLFLLPLLFFLLMLGYITWYAQGSILAPFIYTIF